MKDSAVTNKGAITKGKRQALAVPDQAVAEQQAEQALQTPFQTVDRLHDGLVNGMIGRTDAMSAEAAMIANSLPGHYLQQFSQQLGASEVAPIDGFLAGLFGAAEAPSGSSGRLDLGVGGGES